MKTLNGAPQFDGEVDWSGKGVVNRKLREWAESRKCVNCKLAWDKLDGWLICSRNEAHEKFDHSCKEFSPIETAGGEK